MRGDTRDEQPRDEVAQIMELTGQSEEFVRDMLSVFRTAEEAGAWYRMRWHNLGAGADHDRLIEAPEDLVAEIHARTRVEAELVRHALVIRHASEVIGIRAWLAAGTDTWSRLKALRTLELAWPVPVWVDRLAAELDVHNEDLWRARGLLTAVMALVGPDEKKVRDWLAKVPAEGTSSPIGAMQEDGLDALDRALANAFPSTSADSGTGEA